MLGVRPGGTPCAGTQRRCTARIRSDAAPAPPAGGKTTIIGRDGRMDIGASIRSHAKTVRASALAARHDRVRVLNMGTTSRRLILEAVVEEAAAHLTRSLNESERKRLLEEAEGRLPRSALKAFQAEKDSSEQKTKRLGEQLEAARRLLDEERKRTIKADQFTVSEEGLGEIEDKFNRLLNRSISEGGIAPELEEQLRTLIAHILDSERGKIRERELEAQNRQDRIAGKRRSASLGRHPGRDRATTRRGPAFRRLPRNPGRWRTAQRLHRGSQGRRSQQGQEARVDEEDPRREPLAAAEPWHRAQRPQCPDDKVAPRHQAEATTTPMGQGGDTGKFQERDQAGRRQDLKQAAADELSPQGTPALAEEPAASGRDGDQAGRAPETNSG